MEIVKFWKEMPRVVPGGQGIGVSWASATETIWRSENARIVFGGLAVGQRRVGLRSSELVMYLFMVSPYNGETIEWSRSQ